MGILTSAGDVQAQKIYDDATINLPMLQYASVDTVDLNRDGVMDVVVSGSFNAASPATRVFVYGHETIIEQNGGIFGVAEVYEAVQASFSPLGRGAARWADYDGDGDPDLLLVGQRLAGDPATRMAELYRNDPGPEGVPTFTLDASVVLPALSSVAAAWRDYDGDGDPDLVLAGNDGTGPVTRLFRNDPGSAGTGSGRLVDTGAALVGVEEGVVAWGDYDGDGDPDLVLSGNAAQGLVTRLYRNDRGPGGSTFVEAQALTGVLGGSLSWGDYDGDGDLDLLVSGGVLDPGLLRGTTAVYRNTGGQLAPVGLDVPGTLGTSAWGDYDGDGDLDLLIAGPPDVLERPFVFVYTNHEGTFERLLVATGFDIGTTLWYDSNADGLLDILTMGQGGGNFLLNVTLLY